MSMGAMPLVSISLTCSGFVRTESSPPCTLGCKVFTRPSIISGKPVTSLMPMVGTPAASNALRVPPVEIISNPNFVSS